MINEFYSSPIYSTVRKSNDEKIEKIDTKTSGISDQKHTTFTNPSNKQ